MIRLRNETEDILMSVNKICETFIKQTQRKPQETLELKLTKPRETFSFKPFKIFGLDSNWMVVLTNMEVYNSLFNKTEENNKF